jgi:DNA polymerase-3 subunit delta'
LQFAQITGHQSFKDQLVRAVDNGKVAHAQLFNGPKGSANLALALALASYLNCENRSEDSCGNCSSCHKMKKLIHPDLHFSFPVAANHKWSKTEDVVSQNFLPEWRDSLSKNIHLTLEEWMEAIGAENKQGNISKEESRQIISKLSLKAFEGKFKILIIWLPEFLHPFAANAILKILEEPPTSTIFLLVSNDSEKLISTILSRVQYHTIPKYSDSETTQFLESQGIEPNLLKEIVRASDGDLSQASKLIRDVENESLQLFREWMLLCFKKDFAALVGWSEDFQKLPKLTQQSLLRFGLTTVRECLLVKGNASSISRLNQQETLFITKFSQQLPEALLPEFCQLISEAIYNLERNANPKIIGLDLSISIASIFNR